MTFKVVVEQGEDGWLIGHVPALKGCRSQGRDREELRQNMAEAIQGCVEVLENRIDREQNSDIELVTV